MKLIKTKEEKRQDLANLVEQHTQEGVISKESESVLIVAASKCGISETELRLMIKQSLSEKFRQLVKTFLLDGDISDEEMKSLAIRAKHIGMDETGMMTVVNEEISLFNEDRKQQKKEKRKAVGRKMVAVALAGAGVFLTKVLIENNTVGIANDNNKLKDENENLRMSLLATQKLALAPKPTPTPAPTPAPAPGPAPKPKPAQISKSSNDEFVNVRFSFSCENGLWTQRKSGVVSMRRNEYSALLRGSEKSKKSYVINHRDVLGIHFLGTPVIDDVSIEMV